MSASQVLFFKDSNGVNTCPTNGEFPGVGIGTYGVMCSGRGSCIEGKCVCEYGWSGVSDFYDLSGLDCHSPRIFEQVLWSLAILAWVHLMYLNVVAWRHQKGLLDTKNKEMKARGEYVAWYSYLPTRYLGFHFLISCPSYIILGFLKITTNQAFGVDFAVSFFLCLGTSASFLLAVGPDTSVLQVFASGISKSSSLQTSVEHSKLAFIICSGAYAASTWIVVFLPIALPGIFNGTDGTPRAAALIARNLATAAQFFASATITYFITIRASVTIDEVSQGKAGNRDKLRLILAQLKSEVSNTMKKTLIGTIIYVIFSIPQLWGYFSYCLAFMLIVIAGKSHSVRWYLPNGKIEGMKEKIGDDSRSPTISTPYGNHTNVDKSVVVVVGMGSKNASVEPAESQTGS